MQCLSIADPSIAEHALTRLNAIDGGMAATHYSGAPLRRQMYELIVISSHVTAMGVSLGGDAHIAPIAIGNVAEAARASAIFVASCDGPTVALAIAGQAKSTTVVYYPAALDGETAQRIAVDFADRYFCEGPDSAMEMARSIGYQVLNPIWIMPNESGGGVNNAEMTRLLLDLQRGVSETQADMRHMRDDVAALKSEVRRLGDAQTIASVQGGGVSTKTLMLLVFILSIVVMFAWVVVYVLSGRGIA